MKLIGTRKIETERCLLRRIVPSDCETMYNNWAKYEEVCRYFPEIMRKRDEMTGRRFENKNSKEATK